ncbi:MAG: hypothetical protein GQE15_31975 [Archangiaceae bacterium]|nr:hypothetical protein [Archangiaceae bacterium]
MRATSSRFFAAGHVRSYGRGAVERLLPPRLGALLALESDQSFAGRLGRVLEAAARAIDKLGDLELIKYEDAPIDASADLSLWEELAPVVGSTIADVNALLAELASQFPEGELEVDERHARVDEALQRGATELRTEVTAFGMRVRDPSVVGDRWNLISELQSFRYRFRDRIGAMVFDGAQQLADCRRREVDPGYDEELAATLVVRSTTADLRRLMRSRIHKVSEAGPEDVEWNARQIEKELNAFGRTAAWRALRAHDKKAILEFRTRLKEISQPDLNKLDLLSLLEPFVEFCDNFDAINRRELLIQHDQEVLATMGVTLERAVNAGTDADAFQAFTEAVGVAQAMYGKNGDFDGYLRKLRKTPVTVETVRAEVEQFLVIMANLSAV